MLVHTTVWEMFITACCQPFAHPASVEMQHWVETVVIKELGMKFCTELFGQETRENVEKLNESFCNKWYSSCHGKSIGILS